METSNTRSAIDEQSGLQGCKMPIENFKSLADKSRSYSQSSLKKVLKKIGQESKKTNVNFFISQGYIYLVPESGEGITKDLAIMKKIMHLLQ